MKLTVAEERWPIAGAFTIARGSKTEARVLVVTAEAEGHVGRGEAVPYLRYGETLEGAMAQIQAVRAELETNCDKTRLQGLMPYGAARNAVDCALWDLEAKLTGVPAFRRAGLAAMAPVDTCFTISLGEPRTMAEQARAAAWRPLLKLKIGGPHDLERVAAVRQAAPDSALVVDANEALSFDDLQSLAPDFFRLGVVLIEQPLAAGADEPLEDYKSPVLLCADESLHTRAELAQCARRYGAINIKLDKAGGLTEALALKAEATALGLSIMAGCMVATSLAMAPATILAQGVDFVDLDGPLLLARDRTPGLRFEGSRLYPPEPELWG